jgi:hypothetical protein
VKHDSDIDGLSLRCLVATVRERSVTRAADSLGMAQPALSHVLARLRLRYGDPLLVRGSSGMTPTTRALQLAAAAADVLGSMQRLHTPVPAFEPSKEESLALLTFLRRVRSALSALEFQPTTVRVSEVNRDAASARTKARCNSTDVHAMKNQDVPRCQLDRNS